MTFKKWSDLEKYVLNACKEAVEEVTAQYLASLKILYIKEEFYNAYSPVKYKRSMQFYNSAVTQMVQSKANEILRKIYMNPNLMQHKGASYKNIDGMEQLQWAAQGIHGGLSNTKYEIPVLHYWEDFLKDFNKNIETDLIGSLAAHGLPLKKT